MDHYRVQPGSPITLAEWDPNDKRAFDGDKKKGEARTAKLNAQLEGLQELLYAENKHKVLIVLQAMDTGGKDGVISHVFDGVNPQGVRVAAFKQPTPTELAHDYLWRVHQQTPGKGEVVIFNRSHYEDVLVVRVHNDLVDEFDQLIVRGGRLKRIVTASVIDRRTVHVGQHFIDGHAARRAKDLRQRLLKFSLCRHPIGKATDPGKNLRHDARTADHLRVSTHHHQPVSRLLQRYPALFIDKVTFEHAM